MERWHDIRKERAPLGETILLGNIETGDVFPGYDYWGEAPFPLWCSLHADGMGRCKPTHWQPFPTISAAAVGRQLAAEEA